MFFRYGDTECLIVTQEYADRNNLTWVDDLFDNDKLTYSLYRDDEDKYFAVKGE